MYHINNDFQESNKYTSLKNLFRELENLNIKRPLEIGACEFLLQVGNSGLGECALHPISSKTPDPQYQHIERKKIEKQSKIKRERAA